MGAKRKVHNSNLFFYPWTSERPAIAVMAQQALRIVRTLRAAEISRPRLRCTRLFAIFLSNGPVVTDVIVPILTCARGSMWASVDKIYYSKPTT